jgi:AcrR family transcriptional regulator
MVTTRRGRPRSFDRDAALDQAIRLFWRDGYEATSVRDLSEELGIGAPSLYSAFGDKQTLFGEAVRVYDREYGGFIEEALDEEPTAEAAVTRIFTRAPGRYTRRGLPSGCLIASGDAGTTDDGARRTLRGMRKRITALIADRIRRDVTTGVLPPGTDPEALAAHTMAVLNGIAQQARDGVPRRRLEQVAALAISAWPRA